MKKTIYVCDCDGATSDDGAGWYRTRLSTESESSSLPAIEFDACSIDCLDRLLDEAKTTMLGLIRRE